MRFDRRTDGEVDVQIDAPPSRVWELVCDVALPAKFSTEFQGGEWLDGADHRSAPRSKATTSWEGIGEWETTRSSSNRARARLCGAVGNDAETAAALWRFELCSRRATGTRLETFVRLGAGTVGTDGSDRPHARERGRIIQRRQGRSLTRKNAGDPVEAKKSRAGGTTVVRIASARGPQCRRPPMSSPKPTSRAQFACGRPKRGGYDALTTLAFYAAATSKISSAAASCRGCTHARRWGRCRR